MTTLNIHKPASLGTLLGITRGLVDIDQTAMGKRIGVSRPTISAWERDAREPSFSQVVAWARITGQPLAVFEDALNAETAPAEAEAVHSVRPKGLEPLTFWLVVSRVRERLFWNRARRRVLAALDAELEAFAA